MKVKIEGNVYLESDSLQFIIKEYNGNMDKHGRELYKVHGYFSTTNSAIKYLLKMKIMASTQHTLEKLLIELERVEQSILSSISA